MVCSTYIEHGKAFILFILISIFAQVQRTPFHDHSAPSFQAEADSWLYCEPAR
jgi:hypothetical protein